MHRGRALPSNHVMQLLGTAVAGLALCHAAPGLAQDGAATGAGTVEQPEGENPTDLPAPVQDSEEPVVIASDGDLPAPSPEFNAAGERQISFAADILSYDSDGETTTAEGDVVLQSGDRSLRANSVTWNQRTGLITATGNVRFVDENGNQLFTESVELTDEFEAGAMEDLLLALRQGGRLAANRGIRESDGTIALEEAAYSACDVVTPQGCDKEPSWRITADRVTYDPAEAKVSFTGST